MKLKTQLLYSTSVFCYPETLVETSDVYVSGGGRSGKSKAVLADDLKRQGLSELEILAALNRVDELVQS